MISRRKLLFGGAALVVTAPSIVRAASLMDIRGALYVAYDGPQTETWLLKGFNQYGRRVIEQIPQIRYTKTKFREITEVCGRWPMVFFGDDEEPWRHGILNANEYRARHGAVVCGVNPDNMKWPDVDAANQPDL